MQHNSINNLTVVDSVMGSGKSTWAIKHINESPDRDNFIVVLPTLCEVERFKQSIIRESFVPNNYQESEHTLLKDRFKQLLETGKTIITTHALLNILDDEAIESIRWKNYTLILDECTDLVKPFKGIHQDDFKLLLDSDIVRESPQDDGTIQVTLGGKTYSKEDNDKRLKFTVFLELVKSGLLYRVRGQFFVWLGNTERLRAFNRVYVLTYLFDGSVMKAWLGYHADSYELKTIDNGDLVDYQPQGGKQFADLINLVEDRELNRIGRGGKLTATWYKTKATKDDLQKLSTNLQSFFRRSDVPANDCMWTVFKGQPPRRDLVKLVAPNKYFSLMYKQGVKPATLELPLTDRVNAITWVPTNIRATNAYRHKSTVAVMVDYRPFPALKAFFQDTSIDFNEDLWGLSEMLQLIWRSRIRDGKPINLYIPSERMRNLFKDWLKH